MPDGRAANLLDAISAHGGEAARVINNFNSISTGADAPFNLNRQNLLYFLRVGTPHHGRSLPGGCS